MISILLRLFAAHLVADFFLQFDCINNGKYRRGIHGILFLLLHGLIHAITTYLLLAQWNNWFIPLFIFITHVLTDYVKVLHVNHIGDKHDSSGVVSFLFDQVLHVAFLFLSVCCYYWLWNRIPTSEAFLAACCFNKYWLIVIAYMLVLKPSGILIAILTKRWRNAVHKSDNDEQDTDDSRVQAGAWIGYCERVIALSFILMNSMQGIGFLLAAKSIFRFGDLKEGRETKMTEYVLLGSLISMAIATIVGIVVNGLIIKLC